MAVVFKFFVTKVKNKASESSSIYKGKINKTKIWHTFLVFRVYFMHSSKDKKQKTKQVVVDFFIFYQEGSRWSSQILIKYIEYENRGNK